MNRRERNTDVLARNYTSHIAEYKSISNTQTSDDQSTKRAASASACLFVDLFEIYIRGGMDHDRDRDRNRGEPLMRADLPRVHPYYLRP